MTATLSCTLQKISIHAPLAGSDLCTIDGEDMVGISIHAPLAGSDKGGRDCNQQTTISIHAPLAGSDGEQATTTTIDTAFQSTLPSRGATFKTNKYGVIALFQSTLPSRGATIALS